MFVTICQTLPKPADSAIPLYNSAALNANKLPAITPGIYLVRPTI